MRFLKIVQLSGLLLLAACLAAPSQQITLTVTVTNRAFTSNSLTINGANRIFTNATTSTTVATNLVTINSTKTNLYNQIAAFPFSQITLMDGSGVAGSETNSFRVRSALGAALSGSITGQSASVSWGFISSNYSSGPSTFTMLYPVANIVGTTNQTNQSSDMVAAMNTYPTNFFNTNAGPMSNYITKGASPLQKISSPKQFEGTLISASNFLATNGYTVALTNINSVSSNHINYGGALQSIGPGSLSLQLGTNAWALGYNAVAVGPDAVASNSSAPNTASTALGQGAKATNTFTLAVGHAAIAAGLSSTAIGDSAIASGQNAVALGASASASTNTAVALGQSSSASSRFSVALGDSAQAGLDDFPIAIGYTAKATNRAAIAIGPAVVSSNANTTVFGPATQRTDIPGFLEVEGGVSNLITLAKGTNIMRGSFSYPRFDLTTLAAGNNISVPFGTNRFIRCGTGPASSATICGIIGGATTGGLDGQDVIVFNDTGFSLNFAVNTVDPIAANRINTQAGADVAIADQGWAELVYDGTDARWKLVTTYPVTATATNAVSSLSGSATNLNVYQTVSSPALMVNPLTGSASNIMEWRTTNGAVSGYIATNGAVVATNLSVTPFAIPVGVPFRLFTITNDVVITNVTGPVNVLSNLLGTATLPADFWQPGMTIEIDLYGKYFMTGTLTQSNEVYYGASLIGTNSMPWFAAQGDAWSSHLQITCRTIGASGSLYCQGFLELPASVGGVSGATKNIRLVSGAVTVNTTVSTALSYKMNPGATTTAFYIHSGRGKVVP